MKIRGKGKNINKIGYLKQKRDRRKNIKINLNNFLKDQLLLSP